MRKMHKSEQSPTYDYNLRAPETRKQEESAGNIAMGRGQAGQ